MLKTPQRSLLLWSLPWLLWRGSYSKIQKYQNWEFSKNLVIWEISQIPDIREIWHLGNFPKTQAFEKFKKKEVGASEEFPKKQAFGIFSRYPAIGEISQITRNFGNFRNTQAFGKFLKSYKYIIIRFQQEFEKSEEFPKKN